MDTNAPLILVVEDDAVLKGLLGHELSGSYDLKYASDGEEALALFEQTRPGLVVLDLVIPKLSGFDVLERIRARTDERKDTPILVLSNLSQEEDRTRATQSGANAYLVKAEVSIEEIIGKIHEFLKPAPRAAA